MPRISTLTSGTTHRVGDHGEAKFSGDGNYYSGVIAAVETSKYHANEYTIEFNDGDTDIVGTQDFRLQPSSGSELPGGTPVLEPDESASLGTRTRRPPSRPLASQYDFSLSQNSSSSSEDDSDDHDESEEENGDEDNGNGDEDCSNGDGDCSNRDRDCGNGYDNYGDNDLGDSDDESVETVPEGPAEKITDSASDQFKKVIVGGKEITVRHVPHATKVQAENPTLERKIKRARVWLAKINAALSAVNPDLLDMWKNFLYPDQLDEINDHILVPLFGGNPQLHHGAFIILDKKTGKPTKPMEPGSIANGIRDLEFLLQMELDEKFSFDHPFFERSGAATNLINSYVKTWLLDLSASNYGNLPFRSEAPTDKMVQDIVDSLDINEPWDLLYLAYFYNGVGLCFRGRNDHEVLLLDEIVAVRDENNKQLLRNCPHPFKNQPSNVVGKKKAKQKRKIPRTIYLQDDEHHDPKAPYNVIRKYQSLFPAGTDPNTRFYCYPFTKEQRESGKYKTASGENAVFNPARPLGKNKIGTILSTLCTRIGQPTPVDGLGKFAGHGLRRFAINNLSHMSDSAITAHGGPGSRQAIMCYQDPRGCDRIKTSKAAFGASFENRKSTLRRLRRKNGNQRPSGFAPRPYPHQRARWRPPRQHGRRHLRLSQRHLRRLRDRRPRTCPFPAASGSGSWISPRRWARASSRRPSSTTSGRP